MYSREIWLVENEFLSQKRPIGTHGEIQLPPISRVIKIPMVEG
jgi:hypothetical protein